jgi:HEAT repeat protein
LPLLLEKLQAGNKDMFGVAVKTSREIPGGEVTRMLITELDKLSPARQVLLIYALGDRRDVAVLPTVLKSAANGPTEVRLAAILVLGQLGDASAVPVLVNVAVSTDTELAQAAQASLTKLVGNAVDVAVVAMLDHGTPKARATVLDIAGQRAITSAFPIILKAIDDPNEEVRLAAIKALGRTIVNPQELPILTKRLIATKSPQETTALQEALKAACNRTPDRNACAEKLVECMPQAPLAPKCFLLELLGSLGGEKALKAIATGVRDNHEEIQDTAMRCLGVWPTEDAASELLNLTKTLPDGKFKVRALRGYIRIARQMSLSADRKLAMCEESLRVAQRDEERRLVLVVLRRIPSATTLSIVTSYMANPALKDDAIAMALAISEKIIRVEPYAVAETMRKVLRAGVSDDKAARANRLLQKIKENTQVLFDGHTFNGWEGNIAKVFRIQDGAIVGGNLKAGLSQNEFLATTKEYADFELRLKFKVPGKDVNAGVQFRSRRVPNSSEMIGYQADLGPAGIWGPKAFWGDLYDESRRNRKLVEANQAELSNVFNPQEWSEYRIRCECRRIQIWINDHQTVDYTEPDEKIEQKGFIGLQIHAGPPSEAWYKDIVIIPLSLP